MKKLLLYFSLASIPFISLAQTISTIAGTGTQGYYGDGGQATAAHISVPVGIKTDQFGNIYFVDFGNEVIRKINTTGVISTVAGNHSFGIGYSGDGGPATAAELRNPQYICLDNSGNIFIDDYNNNVIRKVNSSGIINTVAGNNAFGAGYSGDGGSATAAELNNPKGVVIDKKGNMYISDEGNNLIRMVNTTGIISTFAGNGAFGYTGDGGQATASELNMSYSLNIDSIGNIYLADYNNFVVRKINTSGIINTFAGNHTRGFSGDGGPATAAELFTPSDVSIDASGNIFIADFVNNVVRMVNSSGIISTVAGNYAYGSGFSGDGGPATMAELNLPQGITVDGSDNLYIGDYSNNRLRKVTTIITSLPAIKRNMPLLIYPNPATNTIYIETANVNFPATIEIADITGRMILEKTVQSQSQGQMNISSLSSGIYFVILKTQTQQITAKIVKE